MASIRREVTIDAAPEAVWDALRDVGAIHTRLAKGFVADVRLNGDTRVVTFGNGMVVEEIVLGIDEELRRVAWTARGGRLSHHNAAAQVFSEGPSRTRFVWIADILPNELAPTIAGMIEQGLAAIKRTLEG
ncbi:MAG TPA: SRPBCC family protein [Polyangiaceae bacterium]|nr:SRPBCC family protein [Polyangiaceae bacterium]